MQTWMDAAMLIEVTMLSFLVALWITWMTLRGLFHLQPGKRLAAVPVVSGLRERGVAARRQTA